MPLGLGDNLLHYRLIEKIGEGGMGVVWKTVDTRALGEKKDRNHEVGCRIPSRHDSRRHAAAVSR